MDDYESSESNNLYDEDEILERRTVRRKWNFLGFWILGLCNNFAYVIMLSAAKDILEGTSKNTTQIRCQETILGRDCTPMSTGSVLLADILPALLIKLSAPLFIQHIPFGSRHLFVVISQALSYILVALSENVSTALTGVVLGSFASGLGEISYLALASYFETTVITAWSSGTGGAGIIGALTYAIMTDPSMLHLSPKKTLLSMLMVPVLFAIAYWNILAIPQSVHRVRICDPSTYFVKRNSDGEELLELSECEFNSLPFSKKLRTVKPLLKFMIPLTLVYFGEYFINQGMLEFSVFDCDHGFSLNKDSQYRWYQVVYQLGVFVSRSSSNIISVSPKKLPLLALLQLINAIVFFVDAWKSFVPHIFFVLIVVLYEGLLGGASYVNTFKATHEMVSHDRREFCMGIVSISDTVGIVFAGFAAIYAHNLICFLRIEV